MERMLSPLLPFFGAIGMVVCVFVGVPLVLHVIDVVLRFWDIRK
jgi:hypothetical protein